MLAAYSAYGARIMATNDSMTWVESQKRWMKGYNGKTYSVSCKQLGLVDGTEEETQQAATIWWQEKRRQIDGSGAVEPSQIATPVGYFVRGVLAAKIVVKWSYLLAGASHWNFTKEEIAEVVALLGQEVLEWGDYLMYLPATLFNRQDQIRYIRYILEHLD
jgi:hypothetical protein